jgi:hypothetical protein
MGLESMVVIAEVDPVIITAIATKKETRSAGEKMASL